jgi:hypothetical protein
VTAPVRAIGFALIGLIVGGCASLSTACRSDAFWTTADYLWSVTWAVLPVSLATCGIVHWTARDETCPLGTQLEACRAEESIP